jgi:DNA-binding transcriptional ArsR family regulator
MVYRSSTGVVDDAALDAVFGALAHPARRDVLRRLTTTSEPLPMSRLAAEAGLSPQLLNKHLGTLERAGLIVRARDGRAAHAHVRPEPLTAASRWLEETETYWTKQLDALQQYVAAIKRGHHDPQAS